MAAVDSGDQTQTVQVTAKAPKWVLPMLVAAGSAIGGAGLTKAASDGTLEVGVPAAAHAAARAAVKEIDAPSRAEVRQMAREESTAAVTAAAAHLRELLDEKFRGQQMALDSLRTQSTDNAQTLRQIEALLRQRPRR